MKNFSHYIKMGAALGTGFALTSVAVFSFTFLVAQQVAVFEKDQVVSAAAINANFAVLKAETALKPPIGTIVAWHSGIAGVPGLPGGWMQCDGGTVNDIASPLHGRVLPDLNGAGRFLRGGSTAGTLQADELRSHSHQQTIGICCGGIANGIRSYGHSGPFGSTLSTIATGGAETRPINMSVIWIIRIK